MIALHTNYFVFCPHPEIPMECKILAVSQRGRAELEGCSEFTKTINHLSYE